MTLHRYGLTIRAPVGEVWAYVGDSARAAEWSVYFDHIAPLLASPAPDGAVGALRRCFRRADETGPYWDEEVTALVPMRYREIRTYGLRRFRRSIQALSLGAEFRVGQHYAPEGPGATRLTFATALRRPRVPPAAWLFAAAFTPEVLRVFRLNLVNIRAAVEARRAGRPYRRVHPYEPAHAWD